MPSDAEPVRPQGARPAVAATPPPSALTRWSLAERAPAPDRPAAARSGAPLRVLVAEDNAVGRQLMGLVLEHFGARPTLVTDGDEAVEAWRRGRFDVLILDIQMPRMSGLAATRIIRAEEAGRPTPIIVISADFRPECISDCLDAGADLHLAKPLNAASLASALASVLDEGAREALAGVA